MSKSFKQLSYEERIQIESFKLQGFSLMKIAKILGRSPNTIALEFKKRKCKGVYLSVKAQRKAYWKRYLSKRDCMKIALDSYLTGVVFEKLKIGWSPERISGYLKVNQGLGISTKAIYKFVYSRCLERYLFWHKNHKRSGRKRYSKSIRSDRHFIEERPVLNGSGHLEVDFIVSSLSSWCLLVIVDRYTRYTWIKRIKNRKHATLTRVFKETLKDMVIKSITTDNDIAFLKWKQLEKSLKTKIYFCHPYHSWEKGLVENTNRWIRTWIPKRKDIRKVSDEEVREIEKFLNTVPRKVIGFRTASELLLREIKIQEVS